MKLVIVESPTKAKTLNSILGKGFNIKASMGHIRDLPKKGLGVDVEHDFQPEYEVPDKSKKTITELKKYAEEADEIILATDPDREGEAIAWHLREILEGRANTKKKVSAKRKAIPADKKYSRVVFHELTKSAIEDAFEHPGQLNTSLVDAQQARRVLDRLVGYKLSPLLWKKVRFGLSAGRVQSVAVRLIVERERERQGFKPEEYWSVFVDFENKKKNVLKAELTELKGKKLEVTNEKEAKKHEQALNADSFVVENIKKSERQRKAYAPLKTSTLQQICANVFGYQAKKTMSAAQKLFEKGLITYHRTDSLNLSPQFVNSARDFISQTFGADSMPEKGVFYKTNSKNAQEAHEAIRPTDTFLSPQKITSYKLPDDEYKVYSVIWKRSLESQMISAVYDQTAVTVISKGGYALKATGSIVKTKGWLLVAEFIGLNTDEEEINQLQEFIEGEPLSPKEIKLDQHFTQPPARYSDASLIKALEEAGIGRPSTYAPTMSTIQARGYVVREGRYFLPTDVAFVVTDLLVEHFPEVVDTQFTATMETQLDEIALGEKEWVPVIKEFYLPFEKILLKKDKELHKTDVTNLGPSSEHCPKCGKILIFKLGKYGKFLSCSGYPECEFAKPILDVITGLSEIGDAQGKREPGPNDPLFVTDGIPNFGKCPNCEDGLMVLKQGKYGKFLGCSNYPKCKTIQKFFDKIGMKCPKCEQGDVVIKKARGRNFYGCSRYPDCDYSSWKNPKLAKDSEE